MTSPRDASPTVTSKFSPQKILVILGTRPEAIKLCPLIGALRRHVPGLETLVCATAQHREMLDQVLAAFTVTPDIDLNVMTANQSLPGLTARLISDLEPVLRDVKPSLAVVQGDTTTTLCGALASFYAGVPVAHVEAGLRTFDMHAPFPEEMNRVLTGRLTALHFPPTQTAADHLLREGIDSETIHVTGNTGVDAVLQVSKALERGALAGYPGRFDSGRKLIAVTAHRRESYGEGFQQICAAIGEIADRADVEIVWPVHRNPQVRSAAASLENRSNVILIEPLSYVPFVDVLRRATLILTDSGGIQEEAPSLGKPVLVLRDKTERPEAVHAGTVKLVGNNKERIVEESHRLLDDAEARAAMARVHNPYGDGTASVQIAHHIGQFLKANFVG